MAQRNVTHNHSVDFQTSSGKQQWSHSTRYNIAVGAIALSWNYRDTTGALDPTITDSYEGNMAGKEIGFHTTGHYSLKAGGTGPYPVTVYVWGAGGGGTSTQGGGAGGGVKVDMSLTAETFYTAIVGGGVTTLYSLGGFPDGGTAHWNPPWPGGSPVPGHQLTSTKFGGGGRSSFGEGEIAFADMNSPTTEYLLIGGGGGGAANHMDSGTAKSWAGYPEGEPGRGRYYPSDGNNGGYGGTQTSGGPGGGPGGRQPDGNPGLKYTGGPGGTNGGGAGGGGYYGGGGGAGHYTEGGGGSSHVHPTLAPSPSFGHTNASPGTTTAWTATDPWGYKPAYAGDGAGVAVPGGLAGSGPGYIHITFNP